MPGLMTTPSSLQGSSTSPIFQNPISLANPDTKREKLLEGLYIRYQNAAQSKLQDLENSLTICQRLSSRRKSKII